MLNDFNEEWLTPGAVVQVTPQVVGACLREIQRLRSAGDGRSITLECGEDGVWAVPA